MTPMQKQEAISLQRASSEKQVPINSQTRNKSKNTSMNQIPNHNPSKVMTASSKILSSTSRRLSLLNRRLLPLIALAALSIAAQAEPTVPFHGSATFSGEQTVIEPGIWLLTGSGSGVASQVGKLKVEFVYLIDVQQGTVTGSATATAANGDTFSGTVQGNWSQTGITGIVVIVGGTGRFTGATGSAVFETSADTVVYDGTITYARSHRK